MPVSRLRRRTFEQLLARARLPGARFHDLWRTCATILLTQGVHPKIVSEMLGHSSVSITLDTYSHVIPGLGEAAASAMEDALGEQLRRWRPEEVTSPKRLGVDGLMAWKAELA